MHSPGRISCPYDEVDLVSPFLGQPVNGHVDERHGRVTIATQTISIKIPETAGRATGMSYPKPLTIPRFPTSQRALPSSGYPPTRARLPLSGLQLDRLLDRSSSCRVVHDIHFRSSLRVCTVCLGESRLHGGTVRSELHASAPLTLSVQSTKEQLTSLLPQCRCIRRFERRLWRSDRGDEREDHYDGSLAHR